MNPPGYDLFISYRRENGSAEARLLRERLLQSGWRVFLDVADLKKGYFDEALLDYIANAPNFLVVLSPRSLDRCLSEQDWLRREIEQAIATGRNIIPVMLPGFAWPTELPAPMQSLPRHQGLDYSHVYFDAMIGRIEESMRLERDEMERARREREREQKDREQREREFKKQEQPVPPPKPGPLRWLAVAALLVAALAVGLLWNRSREQEAVDKLAKYKSNLRQVVDGFKSSRQWNPAIGAMRQLMDLEPDNAALRQELAAIVRERDLAAAREEKPEPLKQPDVPEPKPAEEPRPVRFSDAIPADEKKSPSKSKAWEMVHSAGIKPVVKEDDAKVVERAKELAKAGRLDEAEREMRRALRISPNQISYRFMRRDLAEILEKKGDLDGALREMAIAVTLWPKDGWYEFYYYGQLLEKKGDLEAALAQYKIVASVPAWADGYNRLRKKMGR